MYLLNAPCIYNFIVTFGNFKCLQLNLEKGGGYGVNNHDTKISNVQVNCLFHLLRHLYIFSLVSPTTVKFMYVKTFNFGAPKRNMCFGLV